MHFILTHTGKQFYPMTPRPEDICIEDIAHALSMICRFTGHVNEFYSVAQHCVIASNLVPDAHALGALLHDASEAYLCDVAKPVKLHPAMQAYREAEAQLEAQINLVFNVNIHTPQIRNVDKKLLFTERRDLMPASDHWLVDESRCYAQRVLPVGQKVAKQRFLQRYEELTA